MELKLNEESQKILDTIIDYQCCPYSDICSSECPCRMFDNSDLSCYQIALKLKKLLKSED